MNLYAHAVVAALEDDRPRFVLGAMLPDLAGMAGLRIAALDDPSLERGVAHHHRVDAAFHASSGFLDLSAGARNELLAEGVPRWSAHAIGHVGVELLLDGCLSEVESGRGSFERARAEAPGAASDVVWKRPDRERRWARLCDWLAESPVPDGYRDPDFVAERVRRILARRPRLALDARGEEALARWAHRARPLVADRAGALLDEVAERLGPDPVTLGV